MFGWKVQRKSICVLLGVCTACLLLMNAGAAEEGETFHALTLTVSGNGAVFPPAGAHIYVEGETAYVRAELLSSGEAFDRWTGDIPEGWDETSPALEVPMDQDRTLTALFTPGDWLFTVMDVDGGGSGTLSPAPGVYSYLNGRVARAGIVPDGGTYWGGWSGDVSSFDYTLILEMNGDKTIVPHLGLTGFTLALNVNGQGGVDTFEGVTGFMPGSRFFVEAIENVPGWRFSNWSGDLPQGANPDLFKLDVLMDQDRTIAANFVEADKVLTILIEGEGATAPPGAPDPGLQHVYGHGENAAIEAEYGTGGWAFSHWSGDIASSHPDDRSITLAMTQDRTIVAHYVLADFSLTLAAEGSGSTLPEPGVYDFLSGNTAEVQAVLVAGGDAFLQWSGDLDENAVPEQQNQSVTLDRNRVMTAQFGPGDWLLVMGVVSGGGAGAVQPGPGLYSYLDGQTATISCRPAAGGFWGGWTGDIVSYNYSETLLMDSDKVVTPNIETSGYLLRLGVNGVGSAGQYQGVNGFMTGAALTLQAAQTDPECFFDGWTGDVPEGSDPSLPSLEVTMDKNRNITANFARIPEYLLTIIVDGTGTTSPAGSAVPGIQYQYVEDTVVNVDAHLGTGGWAFDSWAGDFGDNDASSRHLQLVMDQDRVIVARYIPADFTLTIAAAGDGTTSPAPGVYGFVSGTPMDMAAIRLPGGDAFDFWEGDLEVDSDPQCDQQRVTMSENRTITAVFAPGDWVLTIGDVVGGGTGRLNPPPGSYAYLDGREATVSVQPDTGMYWGGWSGDVESFALSLLVPMDDNKTVTPFIAANGFTLELSVSGRGDIEPFTGASNVAAGAVVSLDAVPIVEGWIFRRWTGALPQGANPSSPHLEVLMDRARSIQAVFTEPDRTLTIIIQGTGETDPPGAAGAGLQYSYASGTEAAVEALFGTDGWAFDYWSGDVNLDQVGPHKISLLMWRDLVIVAHYRQADHTLSVELEGDGQIWPKPGVYGCIHGRQVAMEATLLNHGGAFEQWSGDLMEDATPTAMLQDIVVDRDRAVKATFVSGKWFLTIAPIQGDGGGVTQPEAGIYAYLDKQEAHAQATVNTNKFWGGWSGDVSTYDFSVDVYMNRNKTITPHIASEGFTLSLSSNNYWLGNPSPTGVLGYVAGARPVIRAVPWYAGFFSFWYGDTPLTADPYNPEIEVLMDRDRYITAVFGEKDWYLYIQYQGRGTTVPEPKMYWYMDGDMVPLTAVPDWGYVFLCWDGLYPNEGDPTSTDVTVLIDQSRILSAVFVPIEIQVPDLTGLTCQEAENVLLSMGLFLGDVTEEYSETTAMGFVIHQYPPPGYRLSFADPVDVAISLGFDPNEGEGEGEGEAEGGSEGSTDGEGEGVGEGGGEAEGGPEGIPEGGQEGEGEGFVFERPIHSADVDADHIINLTELLRVIQFFNLPGYCCAEPSEPTEDGYKPGPCSNFSCYPHTGDYRPNFWRFDLTELLRVIQFFNIGGYHYCPDQLTEDFYCPGQ